MMLMRSGPEVRSTSAKGHLETFPAVARMSPVGGRADVARGSLELPFLAEFVEKVL